MKPSKIKGFTLIELLLVIILISVIAAMIIPRFAGRSEKAKQAAADADINTSLAIALDLYEMDNNGYPSTEQGLKSLQRMPELPPHPRNWQGPYIKENRKLLDPWGNSYKYSSPGLHNESSYDLYSLGPDGLEGTSDDIKNWLEKGESESE